MYLELLAQDLNLLQLVMDQARVGGDWAEDGHHTILGDQPSRQLIMRIVEIFNVFQKLGAGLAPILQILPATRDGHQLILQSIGARDTTLSSK